MASQAVLVWELILQGVGRGWRCLVTSGAQEILTLTFSTERTLSGHGQSAPSLYRRGNAGPERRRLQITQSQGGIRALWPQPRAVGPTLHGVAEEMDTATKLPSPPREVAFLAQVTMGRRPACSLALADLSPFVPASTTLPLLPSFLKIYDKLLFSPLHYGCCR